MSKKYKQHELTAREQKHAFLGEKLPYFVFELKEKVNPDLLCEAARKAVSFHPLFGTSLIFNKIYYLEEDPLWEQHPKDVLIAGGKNNCLWELSYRDNYVFLTGSHALTDGMGIMRFSSTLFHIYFELCGVCFSNEASMDFPKNPKETTTHPKDVCPDKVDSFIGVPRFTEPNTLPKECFSMNEKHSIHILKISKDEIHRFANHSETSAFSIIACLLARTAQKTFNLTKGNIFIRVPVNLRRIIDTNTDHNFSQGFSLCYNINKMSHLSDELVETAFRSQLDIFIDCDNVINSLHKDFKRVQDLKEDRESFDSLFQRANDIDMPKAIVSYSHLTQPGFSKELSKMLRDIYMLSDSDQPCIINVGAISLNKTISITINQHVVGNRFIKSLVDSFNKKGINYTIKELNLQEVLTGKADYK